MRQITTTTLLAVLLSLAAFPAWAGWEEGVTAFRAGNFQEAARQFQEEIDQRSEPCFQCEYMLGQTLLKLNKSSEAVTHLRRAYDLNPNDNGVRLNLAKAYLDARRYNDAASLLQTIDANALPAERRSAYYQMRAVALEKSGRGDEALAALGAAAKANPRDAKAQYQYGAACLAAQDADCAVPALQAALRLNGNDATARRALVKAQLLKGRQSQGQTKRAAYQQAADEAQKLASADGSYDNLILLGEAQLGAKQYSQAVGTFDRAAKANGSDWLPLYYQGQALTAAGQYDRAEAVLKSALGKTGESRDQAMIWRQLGFVYEKQRDFADAISAYQRIGDSASIERVRRNQEIAEENMAIEEYNQQVEELKKEQERLRREMEEELPPDF